MWFKIGEEFERNRQTNRNSEKSSTKNVEAEFVGHM
jgi:hypothetical protein